MHSIANGWIWLGFSLFLVAALVADTVLIGKVSRRSAGLVRTALAWTLFWISCALIFNFGIWVYLYQTTTPAFAHVKALEFFTGYVIEKSLSVDNLFAFYMVFQQFHVPQQYQHRVFSYGVWGAIIMRLALILVGVWLVSEFHWLLYVMGAFLFFTGLKMMFSNEKEKDLAETLVIRLAKKFFNVTTEFHEEHFFIKQGVKWVATPLFLALIFIEFSDLVFAMDSIPAIFAITQDPFIVWSSNIFAILGLRALYFVLARMIERFHLLKVGIALILVFVGVKMMIEPLYKMPVSLSLLAITSIIVLFTGLSVWQSSKKGV
ncbi:MAG TPA: TerC/Alx family metal homeostasis membrane protein [Gammaproteobacteria bacterium]|jgi:tellurite resistance protein TerC|nr:TerC/Alx family metal homeostasis membrane protein [Gammaproteobacteria bacterium]